MGWLFVPDLADSSSGSISDCVRSGSDDCDVWVTSNGTPSRRRLSWHGWRIRPWIARLFGTISQRSTADRGAAEWIASLPVSPVSRSPSQVSSSVRRTRAISGRTSVARSSEPDQLSFFSRMFEDSSPSPRPTAEPQAKSSATNSNDLATSCALAFTQRPKPALLIDENASTSLPLFEETPESPSSFDLWRTPDAYARGGPVDVSGRIAGGHSINLQDQTAEWPTPVASNQTGRNSTTSRAGKVLAEEARNWPSPRAEDAESCGNHPNATDSLTGATRNWPTPMAADSGRHSGTYARGNPTLVSEASQWPTPLASEGQQGYQRRHPDRVSQQQSLSTIASRLFWPTATSRDWKNPSGGARAFEREDGKNRIDQIERVTAFWPTPMATPYGSSQNGINATRPSAGTPSLERQASDLSELWPTPTTRDSADSRRATARTEAWTSNPGMTLIDAIWIWFGYSPSHPDQEIAISGPSSLDAVPSLRQRWPSPTVMDASGFHGQPDEGRTSPNSGQTLAGSTEGPERRRKLNPIFVEWLMGLPIGWSDPLLGIDRTAFALWETASSLWLRALLSAISSARSSASRRSL